MCIYLSILSRKNYAIRCKDIQRRKTHSKISSIHVMDMANILFKKGPRYFSKGLKRNLKCYSVRTLDILIGWLWSAPPCIRKPHGAPPVNSTSRAVIADFSLHYLPRIQYSSIQLNSHCIPNPYCYIKAKNGSPSFRISQYSQSHRNGSGSWGFSLEQK